MSAPHPFRISSFRAYFIARLASTLAQMAMVIVIGWQVYDIARETMGIQGAAFQLGLIGIAQFVPLLLLSLVTGWAADRVDRRFIARASVALEMGCAGVLAWLTCTNAITLPALFAVAALLGVARAFASPALQALAPNLVPAAVLPTAIALSSLAWQSGSIVGPAMGGYLYAWADWGAYAASTGLFALAFLCLLFIKPIPRSKITGATNPWAQMVDGLHYVRRNRLVLGAISLDLFAVLLGGATAMLPIYARDILMVGAEGLGHLRAAPAVGAVAVGAWFAWRPLKTNVGGKMLAAVIGFGVATVVFGLAAPVLVPILGPSAVGSDFAPAVALSLAALVVVGATDMVSVYSYDNFASLIFKFFT